MNPWGISGPEFLWLYGGGLVVAIAWAVAVRTRARRPRLSEPPPALDLEQLAFLSGGARRLVELSIARLLDAGALRANRKGTLKSTGESTPDDPLDAEVLGKLGKRSLRADNLVREVKATKPVRQVADSLTARQLLLTPAAAHRAKSRAVLVLYLLLVVGLVRFVNGIFAELPVGYLAIELAVTVVALIVCTTAGSGRARCTATAPWPAPGGPPPRASGWSRSAGWPPTRTRRSAPRC